MFYSCFCSWFVFVFFAEHVHFAPKPNDFCFAFHAAGFDNFHILLSSDGRFHNAERTFDVFVGHTKIVAPTHALGNSQEDEANNVAVDTTTGTSTGTGTVSATKGSASASASASAGPRVPQADVLSLAVIIRHQLFDHHYVSTNVRTAGRFWACASRAHRMLLVGAGEVRCGWGGERSKGSEMDGRMHKTDCI
jgi:hypothetical protein